MNVLRNQLPFTCNSYLLLLLVGIKLYFLVTQALAHVRNLSRSLYHSGTAESQPKFSFLTINPTWCMSWTVFQTTSLIRRHWDQTPFLFAVV